MFGFRRGFRHCRPILNRTPISIVNRANTTVVDTGGGVYTIERTGGATASAVSSVGCPGNFILRVKDLVSSNGVFFGMNTDPLTGDDLGSIDFAWVTLFGQIYESGVLISSPGAVATYYWIWRIGSTLYYGRGATFAAASASPDRSLTNSATLYFDSSISANNEKIEAYLTV